MEINKFYLTEFFLRCFTGILFFALGYDKIFRMGIGKVVKSFHAEAESHHVPEVLLWGIAAYTSVAEFTCGLLLIAGAFKIWALALLGLDLLLVAFAISFMKPLWDMKHVLPRFLFVIILILVPSHWNGWSVDKILLHS
jgi:uncharacterized membrane protein YphA (DoxX/SURF4 family)